VMGGQVKGIEKTKKKKEGRGEEEDLREQQ
jgi:hypothetical protein